MTQRFADFRQREITVRVHARSETAAAILRVSDFAMAGTPAWLSRHPAWLQVLQYGLGHEPFLIEAEESGRTCGVLPLAFVRSSLFGRFLVGLPYLNMGGVVASDNEVACRLVERAADLADDLRVKYLELRHEKKLESPYLTAQQTHKVHMRLALPDFPGPLWNGFKAKVRNEVRKGEKKGLEVAWGTRDLLPEFYAVFSENMRDLGTPVYPMRLFAQVLRTFPQSSEVCVVRLNGAPIAAALLLHGRNVTEVPSASSLRDFNDTCANMLMYWRLVERAIQRGQSIFDFGRSSPGSGTYKFKAQWGARPEPSVWQYYPRRGRIGDMRADNPKYQRFIRMWQRLPVRLTQVLGPRIVRGIP